MKEILPISQIIIIIGTISALMVSYYESGGEIKMDVALVVVIIGVAGGLWEQVLQAFRVSGKIGDIGGKTNGVAEKVSRIEIGSQNRQHRYYDEIKKEVRKGVENT